MVKSPVKSKTRFTLTDGAYPIRLDQEDKNHFTVVYGQQVKTNLSHSEAACNLGECIMHSLALQGKLKE